MKNNQFAYLLLNLLCITPSLSFAMHQLARPILTQASTQIATISPQLINMIRKSSQAASQEKNTASANNDSEATPKIEKLSEQDLRKLIEELMKEQKEQSAALKNLQNSSFGFFGFWLLLATYITATITQSKAREAAENSNSAKNNAQKAAYNSKSAKDYILNVKSSIYSISLQLNKIEDNIKDLQKNSK